MIFQGRRHRLSAWLACFAILLASVAPSISHALSAASGSTSLFGEICTASGIKSIQPSDAFKAVKSLPVQKIPHVEQCSFCSADANAAGLPPGAGFTLVLLINHDQPPVLFYQSPGTLFIWAAAQSRAPPAL